MHFSLLEKFGAAALICAWLLFGVNFLGNMLVHVEEHVSQLPGAEASGGAATASAEPAKPEADFATLLASADPAAGEKLFGKCKACHAIDPAGGNKVGPNLHNVVGRPVGTHEGFAYSDTLKNKGGEWTYDHLNHFLESPKAYAPGTKMSFAGLSSAKDRAEVIAYLRANTESPPPLPEPTAKAEEPAPAEGKASSAEEKGAGEPASGEQAGAAATAGAAGAAGAAVTGADVDKMVAAADPAEGEKVFRKCQACHNADKGGPNKVGPHLYDVVGRPKASVADFNYSPALKGLSGEWTDEALFQYLENPKSFAPGTKMTFAGLSKPEDRAAVISYLRAHSDNPPPLQQ
ncbi:MAG: cytochrome c family protein [Rhodospirillales bacterium]|nr:cytochrome c family protein [Rhodospirillales bacterium]